MITTHPLPFTQPAGVAMPAMTPEERQHWWDLASVDAAIADTEHDPESDTYWCTTCRNTGTVEQNTASTTELVDCPDCELGGNR